MEQQLLQFEWLFWHWRFKFVRFKTSFLEMSRIWSRPPFVSMKSPGQDEVLDWRIFLAPKQLDPAPKVPEWTGKSGHLKGFFTYPSVWLPRSSRLLALSRASAFFGLLTSSSFGILRVSCSYWPWSLYDVLTFQESCCFLGSKPRQIGLSIQLGLKLSPRLPLSFDHSTIRLMPSI